MHQDGEFYLNKYLKMKEHRFLGEFDIRLCRKVTFNFFEYVYRSWQIQFKTFQAKAHAKELQKKI